MGEIPMSPDELKAVGIETGVHQETAGPEQQGLETLNLPPETVAPVKASLQQLESMARKYKNQPENTQKEMRKSGSRFFKQLIEGLAKGLQDPTQAREKAEELFPRDKWFFWWKE